MDEIGDFGLIVLIVAAGFLVATKLSTVTRIVAVPAPALFLIGAAILSDVFPKLGEQLSATDVERIGTVALVVILFDGGMHVGRRRFMASALPITVLGTIGTFGTAGLIAAFAHYALDFGWITAGILGAALAPTDPAVMFSVLGDKEIGGRSGTILEGESGANDPVGIALMIGMLELATHEDATFWVVVEEFALEMAIGTAIGIAGAYVLLPLMRMTLPNEGLYAIRALAGAFVIYGVAAVAHGSGFLAVFIAGLLVADARAPYKQSIERFHGALATLAEIAVFAALGLSVMLGDLGEQNVWRDGILLALVLALAARPLVVGALLVPMRMRRGEKLFVVWGGLKGAVPILLATFALVEGVDGAARIYDIVFVVVALSVLVQGTSIPWAAGRLGVPMRRLDKERTGMLQFVVAPDARAAGQRIGSLPLGERAWVALVQRDGLQTRPRGSTVLEPGDEVYVLADAHDERPLGHLFENRA